MMIFLSVLATAWFDNINDKARMCLYYENISQNSPTKIPRTAHSLSTIVHTLLADRVVVKTCWWPWAVFLFALSSILSFYTLFNMLNVDTPSRDKNVIGTETKITHYWDLANNYAILFIITRGSMFFFQSILRRFICFYYELHVYPKKKHILFSEIKMKTFSFILFLRM